MFHSEYLQGFALCPNRSLCPSRPHSNPRTQQKGTQRPGSSYITHCSTSPLHGQPHRHERMSKRIPTPPPPDDEPRYLTVVHPYPLHANLELHADRRTLALWLACCTGKDVLLAMFHKPAVSPSKARFLKSHPHIPRWTSLRRCSIALTTRAVLLRRMVRPRVAPFCLLTHVSQVGNV